jgi:serine-type D-Ala-D-Ala carboxypeptidase (penicillin-binding protein 5/6)
MRLLKPLLALAAVAALVAIALLVVRPALDDDSGSGSGGTSTASLQQAINGPVSPESIVRQPLNVDLKVTADPVRVDFAHPPRSGLLFDVDTGQVLWRRDPERVLPIASLTKMMTALVVVKHSEPDDRVRVTKEALAYQGSGMGVLPRGGKLVPLEAMLNGLLIVSGNDAAIALSQRVGGTQGHFVKMMNDQAADMGLPCTRYSRPDGYQDAGNHSCAADLAAEARAVLDEPRLAKIVKQRQVVLDFPIKGGKLWLHGHNPVVMEGYPGATGIKTGFTDAAGECIVATATRHGRRLGVVLLDSPDIGKQATQLLNAGFRATPR